MNSIPSLHRTDLAQLIVKRIIQEKDRIKTQYEESKNQIGYFYIDDLLSPEITEHIDSQFPSQQEWFSKKAFVKISILAFK